MPDVQTIIAIRQKIEYLEHDMRRAETRVNNAITELRRATMTVDRPSQIDLSVVEAAVQDLKEARDAWCGTAREKKQLEIELGDI